MIEEYKALISKCLESSAELGAKYLVVHGDEFDFQNITYCLDAIKTTHTPVMSFELVYGSYFIETAAVIAQLLCKIGLRLFEI